MLLLLVAAARSSPIFLHLTSYFSYGLSRSGKSVKVFAIPINCIYPIYTAGEFYSTCSSASIYS
jgi:hypothetical protein